MSEIGTAINGIIEARQVCKNTITTITTKAIASNKVGDQGQLTRLSDIARVELGQDSYSLRAELDNQPAKRVVLGDWYEQVSCLKAQNGELDLS